jgi:DNA ligase-1
VKVDVFGDKDVAPVRGVKPMLAAPAPEALTEADFADGVWASPKVDGYRALIEHGRVWTRKKELVSNEFVQRMLGFPMFDGLDGELCVGPPNAADVFNRTQSGVARADGEPDFIFWVFDIWNMPAGAPFAVRYAALVDAFTNHPACSTHPRIKVLEQVQLKDMAHLFAYQKQCLDLGYEGICLRRAAGAYKPGRSTANPVGSVNAKNGKPLQEWVMLKVKTFSDGEAVVLECVEMMHNDNELEENNVGGAKRSKAQDGMRPAGCLGAFKVRDVKTGVEFSIGSGFDQNERELYWNNREAMVGLVAKYKHFEVGAKNAPRFPTFLGFRDPKDM